MSEPREGIMWGIATRACRLLAAPSMAYGLGRWLARGATSTTAAGGTHGPLRGEHCTSGLPTDGSMPARDTSVAAVASSLPMSGGDAPHAPSAVSGSRESAFAWAEAISGAGAGLSDEGFETEAIHCFVVSGMLLEKVEQWGRPA